MPAGAPRGCAGCLFICWFTVAWFTYGVDGILMWGAGCCGLWAVLPDVPGLGESSMRFNDELYSAWSRCCAGVAYAGKIGWKSTLLLVCTPLIEGTGICCCLCCPARLATSASKSTSIRSGLADVLSRGNRSLLTDDVSESCILSVSSVLEPALLPGLTNGLRGGCVALAGMVLVPADEVDLANEE